MIGATMGAIPSTIPISESIRAACSPEYRSRTIARGTTATVPMPIACATRAAISVSMLRATAQASDAATNSANPAISAGRRPNRSVSGPTKICVTPQPYMYSDSVSWTCSGVAESERVIDGIDAR